MGFCLTRKESVARAVRRVGRELNEDALHQLKRRLEGEATHELRKDIKKSRAILKLVRGGARRKPRRRQARLLRQAARRLNPLRDARAAINTLKRLRDRFETKLKPGAWGPIRDELRRDYDRENDRFERRRSAASVHRTLMRTKKGWGDDHDLEVLRQAALRRPRWNRAPEGEILEELVGRRHREPRAAARSLGARCYAEEASSFRRRLARYWRGWRN